MAMINLFKESKEFQTYITGQVIFWEGQPGAEMYVVIEGEVDILVRSKEIDRVGPGEVLGEMALIDSCDRSATAVARTNCKLVMIDRKRFEFMMQNTPYFANQLLRIITQRLRNMNYQFKTN